MPLYEYQCLDCRQTFEVRRCFSDSDKPASCSYCDSRQTQKLVSKFYAQSTGHTLTASSGQGSCGGCSGGSCGSCHH
jgi:putative FmdB family regulatory protein